jgi:hypothetical protein
MNPMAENTKHCWVCDCGRVIPFQQPEIPADDPLSEQNADKVCPRCGENMYFDEVEDG